MENEVTVYVIQWHNRRNFTDQFFGEDFALAKKVFDDCSSKKSFNCVILLSITYRSKNPIYNKDGLIDKLRGYNFMPGLIEKQLFYKEISNENSGPLPDTQGLCNGIDMFH